MANAKSRCEVKLAMCCDSIVVVQPANNGSIRRCRCVWNLANAVVSTRLRFSPFELPPCGPGQVLIEVKAAGMNFRDVLKALALYPGDAPDARIFGDEVGGIVREVGSDVTTRRSRRSCLRSRRFRNRNAHHRARGRRAADSGRSDVRGGGNLARRLHDFVACAAKRRAIARGRAHSRARRRGWSWDGRDPDRAAPRRGSHRDGRQPE